MKQVALRMLAIAALAGASSALAHPLPRSEAPAPNAVLATSPTEIRIAFSEGLVGRFSALEVTDQAGRRADLAPAKVGANKVLSAAIRRRLPAGTYTVIWRVVGDDTHHVSGRYSFQVKP